MSGLAQGVLPSPGTPSICAPPSPDHIWLPSTPGICPRGFEGHAGQMSLWGLALSLVQVRGPLLGSRGLSLTHWRQQHWCF